MNSLGVIEDMIEAKLMDLHTAFLAKIVSTNGSTATVQPLNMYQQYGESAKKCAVIPNVPITKQARYRVHPTTITYLTSASISTTTGGEGFLTSAKVNTNSGSSTVAGIASIAAGDVVFCLCSERNITEAKNGTVALPTLGRHTMSDCIIIGVL